MNERTRERSLELDKVDWLRVVLALRHLEGEMGLSRSHPLVMLRDRIEWLAASSLGDAASVTMEPEDCEILVCGLTLASERDGRMLRSGALLSAIRLALDCPTSSDWVEALVGFSQHHD